MGRDAGGWEWRVGRGRQPRRGSRQAEGSWRGACPAEHLGSGVHSALSTGHKGAPKTTCSLGRGLLCLPAAGALGVRVAGRGGGILLPLPTHLKPRTTPLVPTQDGPRGQCTPPPKCPPPRKPLPSPGEPLMAKLGSSPLSGYLCQGDPPPSARLCAGYSPPSPLHGPRIWGPHTTVQPILQSEQSTDVASSPGQGQKHRGRDLD